MEYESYLAEQSEIVTDAIKPRVGIPHSYINLNAGKKMVWQPSTCGI
jgi:hypothetical protein